jgi:hypothetical protein
VFALFGMLGCVLLLAKLFRRAAWLGNVAVGFMIGVGAAVAVAGALLGTLVPQTLAAAGPIEPGNLLPGFLILISMALVLVSFSYSRASPRSPMARVRELGRWVLHIALGATFALVFIAGASVLTGLLRDLVLLVSSNP